MSIRYKFTQSVKEKSKNEAKIEKIYELLNVKSINNNFKEFYFCNSRIKVYNGQISRVDDLLNQILKYMKILVNRDFQIDRITNTARIQEIFNKLSAEEFSSRFLKLLNNLQKILGSEYNLKEITAAMPFFQMFFNCIISSKYNEVKKEYFTEEIKSIMSGITFPFRYYIKEKVYKEKTVIYKMNGIVDDVAFDFYRFIEIFEENYHEKDRFYIEKFNFDINYEVEVYKDIELINRGFREISIKYNGETYMKNISLLEEYR